MNLQTVVEDVKGRVEVLSDRGYKAVAVSKDSLKQAGDLVAESFQTLVSANTTAAKDFCFAARDGFLKAKSDGLRAVAADPVSYLPEATKLVKPFNKSVTVVSKTGDSLYKLAKTSISHIQAELSGKPATAEKVVRKARTATRKARTAVKKAAAKVAASAEAA